MARQPQSSKNDLVAWVQIRISNKISVDGIIEVALKEDFTNNFEEPVQEITKEDDGTYTVYVPKSSTNVELKAVANYQYSKVNIENIDNNILYGKLDDYKIICFGYLLDKYGKEQLDENTCSQEHFSFS